MALKGILAWLAFEQSPVCVYEVQGGTVAIISVIRTHYSEVGPMQVLHRNRCVACSFARGIAYDISLALHYAHIAYGIVQRGLCCNGKYHFVAGILLICTIPSAYVALGL